MEEEEVDLRTTLTIARASERGRDGAGREAGYTDEFLVLSQAGVVL